MRPGAEGDTADVHDLVRNLQGMRWGMEEYRTRLGALGADASAAERIAALQDRSDLDVLQGRYDRDLVRLAGLMGVEVSNVPSTPEGNPSLYDEFRSLLEYAVEALGIDLDPSRRRPDASGRLMHGRGQAAPMSAVLST